MRVYKITVGVLDFDGLGEEEIKSTLENTKYPNWCISPDVIELEAVDIGEWHDEHPLNITTMFEQEFRRLFKM